MSGALTGLVIGALQRLADKPEGGATAISGAVGGAIAGVIVGLALPGFFNRWLASAVVGVAASLAFLFAFPLWSEVGWFVYPFMGGIIAVFYGMLVWEKPKHARRLVVKPGEPLDAESDPRDA